MQIKSSSAEGDEGYISAQVASVCVFDSPEKLCSTCMPIFHTCLTVGPIQLFISFYSRAPWSNRSVRPVVARVLMYVFEPLKGRKLFLRAKTSTTSTTKKLLSTFSKQFIPKRLFAKLESFN